MKTNIIQTIKSEYIIPTIEIIRLDNEISLELESDPPIPGSETHRIAPEHFSNEPYFT